MAAIHELEQLAAPRRPKARRSLPSPFLLRTASGLEPPTLEVGFVAINIGRCPPHRHAGFYPCVQTANGTHMMHMTL
jgi:hypothetical protein